MIETLTEDEANERIRKDPTLRIEGDYLVTLDGRKVAFVIRERRRPEKALPAKALKEGKRRGRKQWERTEWIWGR